VALNCDALTGAMIARSFASGADWLWGGGAAPITATLLSAINFRIPNLPLLGSQQLAFACCRV